MSEWFAHQVKKKGCRGQCATFHLLQRDHCLISTEDFDVMYLVVSRRHSYNVILIFVKSLYKVLRFSDKKNRKDHWIVRLLVAVEFNISGTATTWFSSNELLHNLKINVIVTTWSGWSTWKLSLWWQQCLLPRAAHGKNHGHHECDPLSQSYLPNMLEHQCCRKNSSKEKTGLWHLGSQMINAERVGERFAYGVHHKRRIWVAQREPGTAKNWLTPINTYNYAKMQHISHSTKGTEILLRHVHTYELENLCPSVVQIAAPQVSRFWRGPSFNPVPPLSDSHLRQSVSYLCLPCGRPAENVADVTLEAVEVWDDQPSFEGLVDQNDARFDHPVDSEFFNKLRFDEKKV